MICSGLIHIHLWDIAYRHVATLGPLFLVQAVAALVLAVVLVATRVVVVALGCVALMLGTMVGFVLADTVGIFGFKLPVVTGWAYEALVSRAAQFARARRARGALVARDADRRPRGTGDGRRDVGRGTPVKGAGSDAGDADHRRVEVLPAH